MNRLKHITGLLGALALAVLPVWAETTAPLAAKIAVSLSTGLALVFSLAKLKQYVNVLLGALALAGAVVAIVVGKLPAGTSGAVVVGTLAAVLTNLRTIFLRDLGPVPDSEKPTPIEGNPVVRSKDKGSALASFLIWNAVIGLLLCLLLFCATARAETGPQLPADLPGTLGCFDQARDYCGRLVVPAGVGGLSLLTRKASAGAFVGGVGLGVDLWAKRWYTLTPAIAVAAKVESGANYANIAGMVGVAKVAWVGTMVHVDAALTEWSLLAGLDPITLVAMIKGPSAAGASK